MQQDYDAQASQDNVPDAVLPAASPSGANTGAPPSGQVISKEQRDYQAKIGRDLAETRRALAEVNARADFAARTAQQLAQEKFEADTIIWNNYLANLPPEQRATAELRADIAELRSSQVQAQPVPQQRRQAQPLSQQEIEDRKSEIRHQIGDEFGIPLSGAEAGFDETNETAYRASARAIAAQAQAARYYQGQARATGQSLSPRPMGGTGVVTSEQIQEAAWISDPFKRKSTLKELRAMAQRQAGVP